MTLGAQGVMDNNRAHVERLSALMGLTVKDSTPFAAGSMFWGRIEAFEPLSALSEARIGFEPEQGRVDGAAAHALERLTAAIVARAGYRASFEL
jgi:lipopolysaccharide biosynthesis protein